MKTLQDKKTILSTNRFSKDIKKLQRNIQEKAYSIAQRLSVNPFDEQLKIKHLTGFEKIYRVVVFSEFRMIYTFDKENLYLLRIAHRKDIYKNLEL